MESQIELHKKFFFLIQNFTKTKVRICYEYNLILLIY